MKRKALDMTEVLLSSIVIVGALTILWNMIHLGQSMMVVSDRKEVVQRFLDEGISTLQEDIETSSHVEITPEGMRILRPDGKEIVYQKRTRSDGSENLYRGDNLFLKDIETFEVSNEAEEKLYKVILTPTETNGIILPKEYFIRRLAD